jgi:hypothetical protein
MDPLAALLARSRSDRHEPVSDDADPVLSFSRALAVTLGLALIAAHLLNSFALDGSVRQLDADEERTIFSWASSSATFAGALVAMLLALWLPRLRFRFGALAAILAFFSLDDAIGVHEVLSEVSTDDLGLPIAAQRLLWPVGYLPLAAVAITVLASVAQTGRRRTYMIAGVGLLALAIASELASVMWNGLFFDSETLDVLEVAVEESAELAGWILVAASLAATLHLALTDAAVPRSELGLQLGAVFSRSTGSARSATVVDDPPG